MVVVCQNFANDYKFQINGNIMHVYSKDGRMSPTPY